MITTETRRTPGLPVALGGVVGLLLLNSLTVQLATAWQIQVTVGALATVSLVGLAWACRHRFHRSATDLLLTLAAVSVFGWVSAALTALPPVESWLGTAPVPLAFLAVNAIKLSSLAALAVVAYRRRWSRQRLLVRVGDLNVPSGIPFLRWGILGPVVIVAVLFLFLADPAVTANFTSDTVTLLLTWAPVMLAGAAVNAVCEELLYRHALITTAQPLFGTAVAVTVSCFVFGIGHITGSPGGWLGVLSTAVYGAVCAAAMVQNRGMAWNFLIHLFGDLGAVSALLIATSA
ncbi:hypothetical protein CFN78_00175 [Amycolatopsis antarctica]|uniref:CAAX prenyl protease 2/Lysostaphin resistance protein A-like domain-containing protein n=1 Tax=Amycolatopsis antarctica TaxID=1854586 RepID=A0A263D847_9PSEU|nr:hypothetical protein CFN78_00175 [Amycolatopsis antarctica]